MSNQHQQSTTLATDEKSLRKLMFRLPKPDLHCHLEGAISPHKSYEILHRIGYSPAQNQPETLYGEHITRKPIAVIDGSVSPPTAPGLGIDLKPELRASPDIVRGVI